MGYAYFAAVYYASNSGRRSFNIGVNECLVGMGSFAGCLRRSGARRCWVRRAACMPCAPWPVGVAADPGHPRFVAAPRNAGARFAIGLKPLPAGGPPILRQPRLTWMAEFIRMAANALSEGPQGPPSAGRQCRLGDFFAEVGRAMIQRLLVLSVLCLGLATLCLAAGSSKNRRKRPPSNRQRPRRETGQGLERAAGPFTTNPPQRTVQADDRGDAEGQVALLHQSLYVRGARQCLYRFGLSGVAEKA